MEDYILKVDNLHVSFRTHEDDGEIKAVRGVSFELKRGETLAIVGESGSGKSVTAKSLMGLLPKQNTMIKQGEIFYKKRDLLKYSNKEMQKIRGSEISMIFQDPMTSLNPTMTIGKQIIEGLRKHQMVGKKEMFKKATELLELVGIPSPRERMKNYPHQFSGGMRQRVVIAMALACNPNVLIADEPTTALDVTIQAQILDLMRDLQKKTETAIIIITHDLGVVASIAQRVAVMYAGEIIETGTIDEIFYESKHPYTRGLLLSMPKLHSSRSTKLIPIPGTPPDLGQLPNGCPFAARCPYVMKVCHNFPPTMKEISDTHVVSCWLEDVRAPRVEWLGAVGGSIDEGKETLIEVKNLNKYFRVGKRKVLKAVDDVSFDIYKGETLGLVGESGCGKSTIGRTIIQLYDATSGQVIYDGEDVQQKSAIEIKKMKKKMQMIFQDPYSLLNPRMTVLEIIAEGIGNHEAHLNNKEKEAKVYELLESVGLNKKHAHRYPHEFSGGQRQRIGIARALAVEPEFIIADEPIAALDVSIQAQIVNLMQELQQEKGLTYLFIAHDLSMVKHISDRIAVMYLGSIVELAASEDLYENPLHPYSQALLSAIPIPDPKVERTRKRIILEGDVPNPMDIPSGCRFHTRCPKVMQICTETHPIWQEVSLNHFTACHLYN